MKRYQTWNNLLGWLVCAMACTVFISTAERTTSWWDCGEYISTAAKLMVGHPPGAPTFQILGCIANIFTFGHVEQTAFAINILSALCSGFSILFLFWTITMLGKKLCLSVAARSEAKSSESGKADKTNKADFQPSLLQSILIFGAGIIGALAYTFSDSFWFSAVEGEVYAMSSFFTAITFWAILKWESHADEPHHLRWIIFIAFLIGLAIGVHLLNLLVIPACVFIVYYKKFTPSRRGFWMSMLLSLVLLAGILWGIVPWTVKLAGYAELLFVNGFHLPFHSGTIIYFLAVIGALVWGLMYAYRRNKTVLHTALLCVSFLLIGYSTFLTLVIRSNANVPLNENEPKDALSLLSYLNREQYGSRPLFYGQFYNARVVDIKETSKKYVRNNETKRYEEAGSNVEYVYDKEHCGLFPRMYSNGDSGGRNHIKYYQFWSGTTAQDASSPKPSMKENLRFYFRYHLNWMYFRYFMWNFAGRQNNIQGLGYNEDGSRDIFHGNWISGIKFLDEWRLGPQDELPDYLATNHGRNRFFMLPLLLGLVGLWFQYKNDRRNCFIVFLLFFMTGLAIVTYLNEPSTEPRERDYAYAGSFYAYAVWIGLGVIALAQYLMKLIKKQHVAAALGVALVCLSVPGVMAAEGWDDHDRSHRTAAYDFAKNSLLSCESNGVIIANGDNDTFPVWYCQEVEGIKNDVRIINSALANSFWHIQPLFRQVYNSKPLNFTLSFDQYGQGINDYAYIQDLLDKSAYYDLAKCLSFMANDPRAQIKTPAGEIISKFPTHNVKITVPIEEMLANGQLTQEQASRCLPELAWQIQKGDALYRVDMAFLDLVASNFASRPLYFMSSGAQSNVLPLPHMSQMEGNVYRLVPYLNENRAAVGDNGMLTDKTYDLYVNQFRWGNLQDPETAIDPESAAYTRAVRYQYILLSKALMFEGKRDSAVAALDKSIALFPHTQIPFDGLMMYQMEAYFQAGANEKGLALAQQLLDIYMKRLQYVERFPSRFRKSIVEEQRECLSVFSEMEQMLTPFEEQEPAVLGCINICKNTLKNYGF